MGTLAHSPGSVFRVALPLFGANKHRPYARLDQCGFVGFLSRKRVIAMTEADVLMEVAWGPGAQQRYRRKDLCRASGAVLLWGLPKTTKGER